MKTISSELQAHLAGEVTTLATCWRLSRRDGIVHAFTDHDRDLDFSGVTYHARGGFTPSALASSGALNVDNLEVEGMLQHDGITEADILAGRYDFAEVEIVQVNYADLSQGVLSLKRGWLGEVTMIGRQFVAELRGLSQRLMQTTGELYAPSCRATLGDARCKVDMASRIATGTVDSSVMQQTFYDAARGEAAGLFTQGVVTFQSGANLNLSMEVKEFAAGNITLTLPMPFPIAAGDAYIMTQGCDKTLAMCRDRFSNVLNFRGEPHIPGIDRMLETAGTRSG